MPFSPADRIATEQARPTIRFTLGIFHSHSTAILSRIASDEVVPAVTAGKLLVSGELQVQDATVSRCARVRCAAGVADQRPHRQHVASGAASAAPINAVLV